MLHADKQATLLPRVLQIQRLEVVSETPLAVPDDGDQTEVLEFLVFVEGPLLALEDDGHVELLDDQVHDLPRRGARGHGDLHTGALGKTWQYISVNEIISTGETSLFDSSACGDCRSIKSNTNLYRKLRTLVIC